uniref:Uncharacterized protein n=1 Tax=Sipha flava TaxID=143950 RepID=A0A2S2Q1K1_9HEMI
MGKGFGERRFHACAPEGGVAAVAGEDLRGPVQQGGLRRIPQPVRDVRRRDSRTGGGLLSGRLRWTSIVHGQRQSLLSVRHCQLGARMFSAEISRRVHRGLLLLGLDKEHDHLRIILCKKSEKKFYSFLNLIMIGKYIIEQTTYNTSNTYI